MHHTAHFRGSECERGLLDYFQSNSEGHWPITAHTVFQRFALDQFHGIETFADLLAVTSDQSKIWMMKACRRVGVAQKTGSGDENVRDNSIGQYIDHSSVPQ